jgi:adenosylcobinamide kinase/adenosylcobinamide-phosphate guanylyltransferase
MAARIETHRRERPQHWRVREEPLRLACALQEESGTGDLLLIDCLTLWTANCLWPTTADAAADMQADISGWLIQRDAFIAHLQAIASEVIIVTNEVGTSLVPENAAGRLFRDEQGRLNQLVAATCDSVCLVSAGLALRLK